MASYIERLRAPAGHAIRDAGPPNGQVLAAISAAIVVAVLLSSADSSIISPWYTVAIVGLLLTGIVALADRDGWRIREALAYLGLSQRARWKRGALPEGVEEASAWLDDPANADASDLERASVLIGADRWDDAGRLLALATGSDEMEDAALIRLRSTVAARESGRIDQAGLRVAIRSLPEPEARNQLLAAAWSQAWLDIQAGRPWRRDLARSVRELGRFQVPASARILIAIEQLAAPIACIVAILLATVLSWYGSL